MKNENLTEQGDNGVKPDVSKSACDDCGSANVIALDPLTLKCLDCHYLQSQAVC